MVSKDKIKSLVRMNFRLEALGENPLLNPIQNIRRNFFLAVVGLRSLFPWWLLWVESLTSSVSVFGDRLRSL